MFSRDRRNFLRQSASAGMALGMSSLFGGVAAAQNSSATGSQMASMYVDSRRTMGARSTKAFMILPQNCRTPMAFART
jgi:hypothetical protein